MKKHAYLILAHNQFDLLEQLVRVLDDERNDIFLHIDKKVKNFDFTRFAGLCKHAGVFFTPKRLSSSWGSQRLVLAELELFRTAHSCGPYHCYHLLSGVDLPLKTQDEIHHSFRDFTVSRLARAEHPSVWDIERFSRYRLLFPHNKPWGKRLNGWLDSLQAMLGVNRLKGSDIQLQKGGQWGSLTREAVQCLLDHEKQIRKLTRFTCCADEMYKQTILYHYHVPMENTNLRLILWDKGAHPRVLTMADIPQLEKGWTFARKFDPAVDGEVIQYVINRARGGTHD